MNDDLTSYLPAETETRRGLTVMEEEFVTFGTSRILVDNIPQARAQALAEELLGGRGAVRVHGGGFAGTVAAFVPLDLLEGFVQGMEAMAGRGICHVLNFRSTGAALLVN